MLRVERRKNKSAQSNADRSHPRYIESSSVAAGATGTSSDSFRSNYNENLSVNTLDFRVNVSVDSVNFDSSSSSELLFTFDNHTSSTSTPLASGANIDNYTNSSPLNNTINLTHDSNISPLVRNSSHSSTDSDSASVSGSDTDSDEFTDISFDVTQSEDNTSDNSLSSNLFEQINKSGLNIYYANVDSVLNKREELQVIVDNKDPDMIVLTEVYPKNVKPDDISQAE